MPELNQATDSEIDSLWRFACAWWREGQAESICLDWQRRFDLDVSVLVWVAWEAGIRRHALSGLEIQTALALVQDWRVNVIAPVRKARKALREFDPDLIAPYSGSIYSELRSVELMSERCEQIKLLSMRLPDEDGCESSDWNVGRNMATYLDCLNSSLCEADAQSLTVVADKANRLLAEIRAGDPGRSVRR